ncbi:MAG: glycosyltransferase family 2 protein [Nitrospira sp.]|nr:glycosyltransferase family 2 protein [Nitrospira sp.]MCP9442472.1 glycosyltransferase family 2 protein [Nitrospira sp.]
MTVRRDHESPMDVSVIIPTYNRAGLVVEAIESVLRQTRPPREIIVVDDGSTDNTQQVLASFGNRISVIHQENQGVGRARNRALEVAQGRYLAFLDSDDLWMEHKLEWQIDLMERFPQLGFLFSDFVITGDGGQVTPKGLSTWFNHPVEWNQVLDDLSVTAVPCASREEPVKLYIGRLYHALLAQPYVLPSCAIARSRCLTPEIRFAEGDPHCSDWEFFARLARVHPVGFMDVETTINRGGRAWPRLTHMSAATKVRCHLRMIGAVWRRDDDYLSLHRKEVDAVEADLWLQLAKYCMVEADRREARLALGRWQALRPTRNWSRAAGLAALALLPGSGAFLKKVRALLAKEAHAAK